MNKRFFKDTLGWGILLWFIGYVLGFVFFFILPPAYIGWAITPIGALITILVLAKKVRGENLKYYLGVAVAWAAIAMIFDYLFIVLLLKPADGYYKTDVYLYYLLAFALPLATGYIKTSKKKSPTANQ